MAISPLGMPFGVGAGFEVTPLTPAGQGVDAGGTGGADFAAALGDAVSGLEATQDRADAVAASAATGDLTDVADYMIAATEASLATELTVAVRNKAVEAFNDVMRMPL